MPLRARATMPDDLRVRTLLAAGTALYNDGQDEAAGRDLRQAVNLARQRLKASNPLRSAALTGLADLLADEGRLRRSRDVVSRGADGRSRAPAHAGESGGARRYT